MKTPERLGHQLAKEVYKKDKDIGDLVVGLSCKAYALEKYGLKYYNIDFNHQYLETAIYLRRLAYRLWCRFGDRKETG